jgi:hypothetical protein
VIEVLLAVVVAIALTAAINEPHDEHDRKIEVCVMCGRIHTIDKDQEHGDL